MSTWWNGRHAGLRSLWRDPWGFKSPRRHIKKILTNVSIFFIMKLGWAGITFRGFSASELRAKVFSLEETKFLKRKTVDPLNANEQDKSPRRHHKEGNNKSCYPLYFVKMDAEPYPMEKINFI